MDYGEALRAALRSVDDDYYAIGQVPEHLRITEEERLSLNADMRARISFNNDSRTRSAIVAASMTV